MGSLGKLARVPLGRVFHCLLALAALAAATPAQGPAAVARLDARGAAGSASPAAAAQGVFGAERAAHEFGVWGGGSWDSSTLIGRFEDARLAVLALRYARVVARGDNLALKYTLDAVPYAVLSYPEQDSGPPPPGPVTRAARRTITAAGLSPVGFQVNFRRRERLQPFAQASGGFLYFGEPVPQAGGAQFNFTADFGAGLQLKTGARRAWTFGYRHQHISNGYRAAANPGFDSNLFYVGYSIFR